VEVHGYLNESTTIRVRVQKTRPPAGVGKRKLAPPWYTCFETGES
jgi:hypothetical protein